jgi:hypothetical protein
VLRCRRFMLLLFFVITAAVTVGVILGGGVLLWLYRNDVGVEHLISFAAIVVGCFVVIGLLIGMVFWRDGLRELIQGIVSYIRS